MAFRTKQDQVAEILRERIIAGIYKRGAKLKQADIAKELGVSITPVREALQMLDAEGFVLGHAHKGVLVPEFQPDQALEIYELRLKLERDLTAHALQKLTPATLAELAAIQAQVGNAIRSRDLSGIRTANYRFHFTLYEAAARPQTLHFVRVLWAKYPFTDQDQKFSRTERMYGEHETFLKKVEASDQAGAVEAMVDHIRNGWQEFLTKAAQDEPARAPADTAQSRKAPAL